MLGADLDIVILVAAGVGVSSGPWGDRLCDRLRLGSWVVAEEGEGLGANETSSRVNERWSSPGFAAFFSAAGLCDADAPEACVQCGGDVTDGTWAVRAVAMHESDFERARCEVVLASATDGSEFGRARREVAEERSEDVMAGCQSSSGAIDRLVCVLAAWTVLLLAEAADRAAALGMAEPARRRSRRVWPTSALRVLVPALRRLRASPLPSLQCRHALATATARHASKAAWMQSRAAGLTGGASIACLHLSTWISSAVNRICHNSWHCLMMMLPYDTSV